LTYPPPSLPVNPPYLAQTDDIDTWTSAYAAVQTSLSATDATLKSTDSETAAMFALIRPPGHHATTNLCGGYCYLNNVIICASYFLRQTPQLKCVIIDVDFHHGNGVEEILQRKSTEPTDNWRERCRYISLHAHPEYPYYTTHLPTPLPKTVTAKTYLNLLREGLEGAKKWCGDDVLVLVSLGLDTLSGDPIGGFDGFTNVEEYVGIGKEVGDFSSAVNGKTCFLLEGGYVVSKLGVCVENVFRGFINATTKSN